MEGSEVSSGGLAASHSTDCLLKSSKHRGLRAFATSFRQWKFTWTKSPGQEEGVPGDTGAWNKGYKRVKLGGGTHNPTITTATIIYTKRRERGEEGGERKEGKGERAREKGGEWEREKEKDLVWN